MENQNQSLRDFKDFLETYFDGVMTQGLLKPLSVISQKSDHVGETARAWYLLQLQGHSPQKALTSPMVELPYSLKEALIVGFEKSVLDLVLQDILKSFKEDISESELASRLAGIKAKYSTVSTSAVCVGCERAEISKIVSRAMVEGAEEIHIGHDEDFMEQYFIGVKLVHTKEAAIPAVYDTILHAFEAAKNKKMTLDQGEFEVIKEATNKYRLRKGKSQFLIHFTH